MTSPEHTRTCNLEKDFDPLTHLSRQICLPIAQEEYARIFDDAPAFRKCLDAQIAQYPELFPVAIGQGYTLHDILPESQKLAGVRLRRIKLRAPLDHGGAVFTIRPAFVLPYMTGYTAEVEKALLLRRWAVPHWVLAYIFGRDEHYWWRLEHSLGRNSVVGTTVKDPELLPTAVLADEKHAALNGETVYIATTVANECVLGVSVSLSADTPGLQEAYGHFKTEARNLAPAYAPHTVNTDGWSATQAAWQSLFPTITLILCFLHAFLNIRACCKHLKAQYAALKTRVWEAYHAADAATFTQKLAELRDWATAQLPSGRGLEAVLKLCAKAPVLALAYQHPTAYRTSNMIDRQMEPLDRYLDGCKNFHGHLNAAEYGARAWALLHNFHPYCPRAAVTEQYQSPAHKLNGHVYHDNWLHNLLISASMGGFRQ